MKTSSVEAANKQNAPKATIALLRDIRITFLLGSMYSFPRRKVSLDTRKAAILTLVLVIFIPHLCSFAYTIYKRALQGEDVLLLSAFGSMHSLTLVLFLVSSKVLPEGLIDFEHLLSVYEIKFKCQQTILKYDKHLKMLVPLIALAGILCVSVFAAAVAKGLSYAWASCPSCYYDEPWKTVVVIVNILGNLVWCMQAFSQTVSCVVMARVLKELFRDVANDLKSLDVNVNSRMGSLVQQHEMVVELLNTINGCVQHFMFVDLFPTLPIILAILYGALTPDRSFEDKVLISALFPASVVIIGARTWFEAQVHVWAHEPLKYLWKLQYEAKTEKNQRIVSQFITRLTSDTIAYNIYGMMTVTMTTLLTLFGTLITYIIVVLQFQSPSMSHLLKNVPLCALNGTEMLR